MFLEISKLEALNQTFDYINIFIIGLVIVRIVNLTLKFHQQHHYNYKKYFTFLKYFYISLNGILLLGLIPMIFFLDHYIMMIINSIYLLCIDLMYHRIKKILPLIHTFRVLRIIIVNIILNIVLSTLLMYNIHFVELMSMLNVLIIIQPILVILSSFITYPIDYIIKLYYKHKAKKVRVKDVIGVSGSFGKTSTKDFIYEILKDYYLTSKTPNNYNSEYGIIKTLNNYYNGEDILVLEYGVSEINDMDRLLDVVTPTYVVYTDIATTHINNFKSIENILNEKMKLVSNAQKIVINNDNEYLRKYFENKDVITVGKKENSTYQILDVTNCENISFNLRYNQKEYKVQTNLNGQFNALNIALAIAVANSIYNIDIESIITSIGSIKNTQNRLEINHYKTKTKNVLLINDSYNSNISGFKGALNLLQTFEEKKYLITPGICDSGDNVNIEISNEIINNHPNINVIIIKCDSGNIIYQELKKYKYGSIKIVNSLKEALKITEDNSVCLIENDIPDIYNYKRLFWSVVK